MVTNWLLVAVVSALGSAGTLGSEAPSPSQNTRRILPGLPWPQALQGHDDENWPAQLSDGAGGATPELLARYAALKPMQPGIRRYNMFWSTFESAIQSSTSPLQCPPETTLTPATEAERKTFGYHLFHCYSSSQIAMFDTIFNLDREIGAQNAAILYSAPGFYRHPNCTGFKFGPDVIKSGCAPVDEHMDDYEDYVRFLVQRWSVTSLKHFVVWNEVASAGWMDMSPFIPNRAGPSGSFPLSETQFDLWVSKYASLVERTSSAVRGMGYSDGVMVWTSNDRLWERPKQRQGDPLHTGVKPFQDRLWPKLAAMGNVTFGTAVHPYDPGNPFDDSEFASGFHPQAYTFRTLTHVVAYLRQQVASVLNLDPSSVEAQPYQLLYASEQGWPYPMCCDNKIRARNICYAQALSEANTQVVSVTHNYFQDNAGGSEQGGQDYGLIPGNITGNLSNGAGHPTFDAYVATSPAHWGVSDDHFCCVTWRMGCKSNSGTGTLDPLDQSGTRITVHGWAWDERAPGAGGDPVQVKISFSGLSVPTRTVVANVTRNDLVAAGVAPNAAHGFLEVFDIPPPGITGPYKVSAAWLWNGTATELESSPRCGDNSGPHDCPLGI